MHITSIREFNLVEFQISIDAIIKLKWTDARLKFRNLQDDIQFNVITDTSSIWKPNIYVEDGSQSPSLVTEKVEPLIRVNKKGQVIKDNPEILNEGMYLKI